MNRPPSVFKQAFRDFFSNHSKMVVGGMFFRQYDSGRDIIVSNYSPEDWNRIFPNYSEDDLRDLSDCLNVVTLLWGDCHTEEICGMLYFEEDYYSVGDVSFHGGTWNHDTKYFIEIFRSIIFILDYVSLYCNRITTTCGLDNKLADRFQKSLGFEEVARDDARIYKVLNGIDFLNIPYRKRLCNNKKNK